jgi:hypothetical protein
VQSEDAAAALCQRLEARHREEVGAVRAAWQAEVQSLREAHAKDLGEVTAGVEARVASATAAVVTKYKQRLGAFRSKVEEAEAAYRMKHVHILGALDESRREMLALKAEFEVRQREYEHQLEERGRAIDAYQRQLAGIRSSKAGADRWRSVALELAASIVELGLTQGEEDGFADGAGMDGAFGPPQSRHKRGKTRDARLGDRGDNVDGDVDDGATLSSGSSSNGGAGKGPPAAAVRRRGGAAGGRRIRDMDRDRVWVSRDFLEDMVQNSKVWTRCYYNWKYYVCITYSYCIYMRFRSES